MSVIHIHQPPAVHRTSNCPGDLDSVWTWWREQMPVARTWAYFDHAAVGPLTHPAADTVHRFADTASMHGDVYWMDWSAAASRLRDQTAELTGCEPGEVTLVPNTTAGVNLVAEGFPWQRGDTVVLPEGEFPSNRFPWMNQSARGVGIKTVPRRDGVVDVDDLIDAIDDSTRLIAVSWVGYASGFRVDIERLVARAHERGVLVFLDAIQGLGMYPIDMTTCDVDFLAADGHKWMLGPEGAGVTIIRRRHLESLRCPTVGWGSVKNSQAFSHAAFELTDDASRFEGGSTNHVGLIAFSASLEMFLQVGRVHGPTAIADRVLGLAAQLRSMLTDAGAKCLFGPWPDCCHESAIVTFEVPGVTPADFRIRGLENGVVVSCRGGGIRASVHAYNDDDDLRRLVNLISR